jgi:MoaA/NifB/PqqE/SkfB family radical SAM enzyme
MSKEGVEVIMVFPFLPCTLTHRTESCTARRDGKDDSSPIVSQGLTIDGDGRRIYGRETLPFDRVGLLREHLINPVKTRDITKWKIFQALERTFERNNSHSRKVRFVLTMDRSKCLNALSKNLLSSGIIWLLIMTYIHPS